MKWFTTGATIIGALIIYFGFWNDYGWITKMVYAAQHEEIPTQAQMSEVLEIVKGIQVAQDRNQIQWECDETGEEIPELKKELAVTDDVNDQIDLQEKLDRQQEVWTKLECVQFTE